MIPTRKTFIEFFGDMHGYEPFPWQIDLAERVADGWIPEAVDVPTGLGKTSLIDIWIFALAHKAVTKRKVPLRMCFVVDRRLVVDEAYDEALWLAQQLATADDANGIVSEVARSLRRLTNGLADPLEVVRMRGGVTWESRWLPRPDQPALIVGTVDQFGSRLLFRGYGASKTMRPIDAALVGIDTWVVVDEAHIAEPLVGTVARVSRLQRREEFPFADQRIHLTRVSATLSEVAVVFRAESERQKHSAEVPQAAMEAAKRLEAYKPAALFDLAWLAKPKKKGWLSQSSQLGEALSRLALSVPGNPKVVAVVANTISTARAAHDSLLKKGERSILLIGRSREYERARLLDAWLDQIGVGSRRNFDDQLYVVATQTIEVGANLDFDALITECAPLASLVQRFGRVNRVGTQRVFDSAIVHAGFAHDADRIYGNATAATWDWLSSRIKVLSITKALDAGKAWPAASIDFGPEAVQALRAEMPGEAVPAPPFTPTLLGAHLENWARTYPEPLPDQPVGPFLHGVGRDVVEVSVGWRVPPVVGSAVESNVEEGLAEAWQAWLGLMPPVEWELVTVPIHAVRAFLNRQISDLPIADLEATHLGDNDSEELMPREQSRSGPPAKRPPVLGVVYRGPHETPTLIRSGLDVGPGNRVILRCDVGGHDAWGWTGSAAAHGGPLVPDVADLAPSRQGWIRRLSWDVLKTRFPARADELLDRFAAADPEDPRTAEPAFQALLTLESELGLEPPESWSIAFAGMTDSAGPVWLARAGPTFGAVDAASDEDEASTSLRRSGAVTLSAHSGAVARRTVEFATNLGLDERSLETLRLAAELHDQGKREPRFQCMLHGGDELAAAAASEPLAKSGVDPRSPEARAAARVAGVPRGFRHEAVSQDIAAQYLEAAGLDAERIDRDLLLHLVAAHHGRSRPLFPSLLDKQRGPLSVDLDGTSFSVELRSHQVRWDHPARFSRLNQRYGWWGLALLEAVLRLADMMSSAEGS